MTNLKKGHYKKSIGQIPGAVIYTGHKDNELTIESFDYNAQECNEINHKTIEESLKFKTTESITWININGLNNVSEIEALGQHYEIHPLVLEDIVNISQRPKIDEYDNYIFLVLKMLYYNKNQKLISEQVNLVLGSSYVLTFQESEGDVFDGVRNRLRTGKGRIRSQNSDYLLYTLIDSIVDHYFVVAETINDKLEFLENKLFTNDFDETISQDIQSLKREVLKIRRSIFPLREVISRIEKYEGSLIHKKTKTYYRDIFDHIIQVTESFEIYREMSWSLMDMYMTKISNKMNEVMKVLTVMASIFIPLTFFAGIYGMNFKHMPELEYQYAYPLFWFFLLVILIIMVWYFRRKKWL